MSRFEFSRDHEFFKVAFNVKMMGDEVRGQCVFNNWLNLLFSQTWMCTVQEHPTDSHAVELEACLGKGKIP